MRALFAPIALCPRPRCTAQVTVTCSPVNPIISRKGIRPSFSRSDLLYLGVDLHMSQVRDFVYISDRAYTKEQILAMEKVMLNTLKFNLTVPTAHNFLCRYLKVLVSPRISKRRRTPPTWWSWRCLTTGCSSTATACWLPLLCSSPTGETHRPPFRIQPEAQLRGIVSILLCLSLCGQVDLIRALLRIAVVRPSSWNISPAVN